MPSRKSSSRGTRVNYHESDDGENDDGTENVSDEESSNNRTRRSTRGAPRRGKVSQDDSDTNKVNDSDDDSDKPLSSRSRKKNGKLATKKHTRTRKQVNYTEDEEAEGSGESLGDDDEEVKERRRPKRQAAITLSSCDSSPRTSRRNKSRKIEVISGSESRESTPVVNKRKNVRKPVVISSAEEEEEDVDTENNQVDLTSSEEESSNYDSPPHKKKRSNYSRKGKPQKKKVDRKKKKKKTSEESDSEESDERPSRKVRGAKKRKRKHESEDEDSGSGDDFVFKNAKSNSHGRATTGRVRTAVQRDGGSGGEFDSDIEDDEGNMVRLKAVPEVDIDGIDKVMDHREGRVGATGESTEHFRVVENGDPNLTLETEERETQYLIKWQDKAHIFNTWETEETLNAKKIGEIKVKGYTKLSKYQGRVMEYNSWKKRASPEDIEFYEVDIELGRELAKTYREAERVFCRRKNEEGTKTEYYIKWTNLPYSEATWEDEELVKKHYRSQYESFKRIKKAKAEPKDYKASMRGVKTKFKAMKEQPDYIGSEELRLRDYQLDGISFLLNAWCKGNSVILGDEMGLGKTIQTICFLKYLFHNYNFKGPMLVCVPLSTMMAWQKAFVDWAPDMNTVTYLGDQKSREIIREYECENDHGDLCFNVLLTSYEMAWKDKDFFQDIVWSNIVVDEAHRLKNEESLLYKVLNQIDSHHRLLLTGTPLQNNLKELWCLLNYLQLQEIGDWATFENSYGKPDDVAAGYVGLHSLLKPFIIRRLKKDVEKSLPPKVEQILRVDMTRRQKNMYKNVLTKNYDFLSKGGKNQVSLINIMMQLRKTSNHLELIHEQDYDAQKTSEERYKELVYGSGKMVLLDKLLTRFREKGDRVLIFSQMVIMLNIIEEYLQLKRFQYQRLDGSVNSDKRKQAIAQFNDPTSNDFCFLLSTKAGGLGINLQTANRVIIYDSDFNPQNDLQAIARAHRIGQKNEVKIFRFVASGSVDEDIIQRAKNKMVLDHLVIQNMDTTGKGILAGNRAKKSETAAMSKDELNTIIKFGAADLFKDTPEDAGDEEKEEKEVDLDAILEKAETREEEEAPISEANRELLSAFKCTNLRFEEEEQEEEKKKKDTPSKKSKKDDISWGDIIPENMREKVKPKQIIDGLEVNSEDEYRTATARRERRKKIKNTNIHVSDAEAEQVGSDYKAESEDSDESEQEEMPENEALRDMIMNQKRLKNYPIDSFKCTAEGCDRRFHARDHFRMHFKRKHNLGDMTEANLCNLPEIKSQQGICHLCGLKYVMKKIDYKVHVNAIHGGQEPEVNYNIVMLRELNRFRAVQKVKLGGEGSYYAKKNLICLECSRCFNETGTLRNHMKNSHSEVEFVLSEKNYINLPEVKSTYFRCFPCSSHFSQSLQYRVHVMRQHKSEEPEDNFNAEMIAKYEEETKMFICLECKERFSSQFHLRTHMLEAHQVENYEIQDDNYYNLPQVLATSNKCQPCNRQFGRIVLYRLHIKNKHNSEEPAVNHQIIHSTMDRGLEQPKVKKEKKWKCPKCSIIFPDHVGLRQHILETHKLEKLSLSQEDYEQLPSVESTHNRCLPCNKGFLNNLRYRIHIKESHEGIEPKENFSPELFANADDFVCLICVKKYNGRQNLKNHLVKTHLGLEDGKDATKDNSESETPHNEADKPDFEDLDPLTGGGDESTDNGDDSVADVSRESADIQEVDIECIKKKTQNGSPNDSSDKENNFIEEGDKSQSENVTVVKSSRKSRILTDREKELLEKMFHNLKKFGCAFCKERFESKSTLAYHEKGHLKEKKPPKKPIVYQQVSKQQTADSVTSDLNSPKSIKKNTNMSAVQEHDNKDGPPCFICGAICKDASNYKNHVLSHYYRNFDGHIPATKPFTCPICEKPARDKITQIRHYAFTHQKIFELTDLTPDNIIPPGIVKKNRGNPGPRTPKKMPKTPEKILEQEEERNGEAGVREVRDPSECVSSTNGENMSGVVSEEQAGEVSEDDRGEKEVEEQQEEENLCDNS